MTDLLRKHFNHPLCGFTRDYADAMMDLLVESPWRPVVPMVMSWCHEGSQSTPPLRTQEYHLAVLQLICQAAWHLFHHPCDTEQSRTYELSTGSDVYLLCNHFIKAYPFFSYRLRCGDGMVYFTAELHVLP